MHLYLLFVIMYRLITEVKFWHVRYAARDVTGAFGLIKPPAECLVDDPSLEEMVCACFLIMFFAEYSCCKFITKRDYHNYNDLWISFSLTGKSNLN